MKNINFKLVVLFICLSINVYQIYINHEFITHETDTKLTITSDNKT